MLAVSKTTPRRFRRRQRERTPIGGGMRDQRRDRIFILSGWRVWGAPTKRRAGSARARFVSGGSVNARTRPVRVLSESHATNRASPTNLLPGQRTFPRDGVDRDPTGSGVF